MLFHSNVCFRILTNIQSIGEGAEIHTVNFNPKPFNRSFAYTVLVEVLYNNNDN